MLEQLERSSGCPSRPSSRRRSRRGATFCHSTPRPPSSSGSSRSSWASAPCQGVPGWDGGVLQVRGSSDVETERLLTPLYLVLNSGRPEWRKRHKMSRVRYVDSGRRMHGTYDLALGSGRVTPPLGRQHNMVCGYDTGDTRSFVRGRLPRAVCHQEQQASVEQLTPVPKFGREPAHASTPHHHQSSTTVYIYSPFVRRG
jgi:hypothetical protein